MKKTMIGCLFLFFTGALAAQTRFGIKGGMTISNMHGDPNQDPSPKTGLFLGAYLNVPVTNKLSIESGLAYTQKGAVGQGDVHFAFYIYVPKYKIDVRYGMLELPVLANFAITRKFHLVAGPQVSFLAYARYRHYVYVDAYEDPNRYEETYDDGVGTRIYAGLIAGAGYHFTKKIACMVQYDMDLNDHIFYGGNTSNKAIKIGVKYNLW